MNNELNEYYKRGGAVLEYEGKSQESPTEVLSNRRRENARDQQ